MSRRGEIGGLRRMKALEIDDVGYDPGRHAVAFEHVLEETRRHDQRCRAAQRTANGGARACKEDIGLAAPVIDHGRDAPPACDPYRRRRAQMPRPAGVGHDMDDFHLAGNAPKSEDVRHEPKQAAQTANGSNESWLIGRVGLHERHRGTFALEQFCQLPRLVGHAAGRGRQRTDQRDSATGQRHRVARPSESNTAR